MSHLCQCAWFLFCFVVCSQKDKRFKQKLKSAFGFHISSLPYFSFPDIGEKQCGFLFVCFNPINLYSCTRCTYTVLITQQLNKTLTTHSLIQAILAMASKNCKWKWRTSVAVLLNMLAITSLQTTKYCKSGICSSMLSTGRPCNCACSENEFLIMLRRFWAVVFFYSSSLQLQTYTHVYPSEFPFP